MAMKKFMLIGVVSFVFTSCFKEIDTAPMERTVEDAFTVQNSIQTTQTYYYLYENVGMEVSTSSPRSWDLAFESAGDGNKVLIGWATGSIAHKTGRDKIEEFSQNEILSYLEDSVNWTFDDPAYTNFVDSLSLQFWEDGKVYIQNRGVESDNYYLIQFVEKTDDSYTFNYAKATDNSNIQTFIITRSDGLNYIYFSFDEGGSIVTVEPRSVEWDMVFSPYLGWWETLTVGEYSPYTQSGILINNEGGVRVAQIFDENIDFEDIDSTYITASEFTDWKGVIGSNWKLLGGTDSENLYNMDPNKKYLLKKYDIQTEAYKYFKLRIIDYKLNGKDHHPTVEFKFLGNK